jgi:hypothetical protein
MVDDISKGVWVASATQVALTAYILLLHGWLDIAFCMRGFAIAAYKLAISKRL